MKFNAKIIFITTKYNFLNNSNHAFKFELKQFTSYRNLINKDFEPFFSRALPGRVAGPEPRCAPRSLPRPCALPPRAGAAAVPFRQDVPPHSSCDDTRHLLRQLKTSYSKTMLMPNVSFWKTKAKKVKGMIKGRLGISDEAYLLLCLWRSRLLERFLECLVLWCRRGDRLLLLERPIFGNFSTLHGRQTVNKLGSRNSQFTITIQSLLPTKTLINVIKFFIFCFKWRI